VNFKTTFVRYFAEATGHDPAVEPVTTPQAAKLPLYLRSYYDLYRATIFDRPMLLAVQKERAAVATPAEYAAHHNKLRAVLGGDVALVLPVIASYTRQQLVRQRVPFVVPDRQMFLPTLLVDLRERFPRHGQPVPEVLSAPAQVVLLRHLLGQPVEGLALGELAAKLGYTAMTLSNVRQELEAAKFCQTIREQRRVRLTFPMPRKELWTRAEPLLQDPVKDRYWVQFTQPRQDWLRAGLTALADLTMVADDTVPTYAVKDSEFQTQRVRGQIIVGHGPEGAQARMEAWRYDPRVLADGKAVDRLSLVLSLRHADDERVTKALRQIVEEMPW
jgi:hypothetical protein